MPPAKPPATPRSQPAGAEPPSWGVFTNGIAPGERRLEAEKLPPPPPWRRFVPDGDPPYDRPDMDQKQRRRGRVFRLPRQGAGEEAARAGLASPLRLTPEAEEVRLAVNAAILLRRPLFVTGTPGSGKTSLAYAIADELGLGRVLYWPITPRSEMRDGLYRYEALDRLRESQPGSTTPTSKFITLGPLGTAFLPFAAPRVLLIDEIDKSDLQLPNELLHLFEEGSYEIPQLRREANQDQETGAGTPAWVETDDPGCRAPIQAGRVQCWEFPIVVLTSNREREFPPAFHRRCIRVDMPSPTRRDTLLDVARTHFIGEETAGEWDEAAVIRRIDAFLGDTGPLDRATAGQLDRATDQLLNALHLLCGPEDQRPSEAQVEALQRILFKRLSGPG